MDGVRIMLPQNLCLCLNFILLTEGNKNAPVFQLLLVLATSVLLCSFAVAQDRVLYHIDDAAAQATKGLRNIRNHLDVAPDTKITVVTHANGVDFLMDGAKDTKDPNIDYGSLVSSLKARGVTFEICEITLLNRNLKKSV